MKISINRVAGNKIYWLLETKELCEVESFNKNVTKEEVIKLLKEKYKLN